MLVRTIRCNKRFATFGIRRRRRRRTVSWSAAKHVECHIVQHRMAEVRGECLWAEACFGDADALVKFNDKEKIK